MCVTLVHVHIKPACVTRFAAAATPYHRAWRDTVAPWMAASRRGGRHHGLYPEKPEQ